MIVFSSRTFQIIKQRLLYDFMLETVGRKIIARKGLVVRPYYVFREGFLEGNPKDFVVGSRGYEISFLTTEDVQNLDRIEGRIITAQSMQDNLNRGHKCLGLKIDGNIAAFTWCRIRYISFSPNEGVCAQGERGILVTTCMCSGLIEGSTLRLYCDTVAMKNWPRSGAQFCIAFLMFPTGPRFVSRRSLMPG